MPPPPSIIAHRGASGYRPEHTLAGYDLAIDQGADFLELDVVPTRDGALVIRHESEISRTTDVADHPEFADRRTTKTIDGREVTGWFTEDFTLAELKTLRAKERIPQHRPDNAAYDGLFEVPTLQEVTDLARRRSEETGRVIGLYPETKNATYFRSIGLPLERALVDALETAGYRGREAPVFIQSFEVASLKAVREMSDLPLSQLVGRGGRPYDFVAAGDPRTSADLLTPEGLAEVAAYADALGPDKDLIVPRDAEGNLGAPTSLVEDAHAAGLAVHPWTFRIEDVYLPRDCQGNLEAELRLFYSLGIDALHTDHPDVAYALREPLGEPGLTDARIALRALASGAALSPERVAAYDLNRSGALDLDDVVRMLHRIAAAPRAGCGR